MLDAIKKEYRVLLVIFCLFLLNLGLFWLKQGCLIIDTGREFYIPWQILKGHVLYKDIFNVYGPLSYQINALAYLVFGQKISSLVAFGVINSFVVLLSVYFISREFLNKVISFLITVFVMYVSVFAVELFNFNLPYSYAMPYSLSAFLLSVLFLIKYIKEPRAVFSYISCFFAGVSIANKYDYVLLPLFIGYVVAFLKPLPKQDILKSLGLLLLMPFLSFGVLFLQGLSIKEFIQYFVTMENLSHCGTLKYLYTYYAGTYFELGVFKNVVQKFLPLAAWFFCLYFVGFLDKKIGSKFLKNAFRVFVILLTTFLLLFVIREKVFGFFPMLNFILFIVFFKHIYSNKPVFALVVCAILSCLKSFFALNIETYGTFTIPLLLISICVILIVVLKDTKLNEFIKSSTKQSVVILLIGFIFMYACLQYFALTQKTALLKTPKGNIYNYSVVVNCYQQAIDYILKNTKETDMVVIWPETPFINFVTNRDSDNYYTTLIPLYLELFKEENVIKYLNTSKPEYIILNNRDTKDYGFQYICKDYALGVCSLVNEKYNSVKIINDGFYRMLIYKRKDLK